MDKNKPLGRIRANILVIDDDLDTLKLLELALKRAGHAVQIASGYEQMMERVKHSVDHGTRIDLLILDLMMPGFSGFDILDLLRMYFSPVPPVIVLTALSGMSEAVRALEHGATKFLTKPTTQEKLLGAIQEVLSGEVRSRF